MHVDYFKPPTYTNTSIALHFDYKHLATVDEMFFELYKTFISTITLHLMSFVLFGLQITCSEVLHHFISKQIESNFLRITNDRIFVEKLSSEVLAYVLNKLKISFKDDKKPKTGNFPSNEHSV